SSKTASGTPPSKSGEGSRKREPVIGRRLLIKRTATIAAMLPLANWPFRALAAEQIDAEQPATLAEVPLAAKNKVTIERRSQVALIGINRPYIQNRIDPEAFQALARAYYDYDRDPTLRAAILFGHGDHFSRGIDVDGFKAIIGTGKPIFSGSNVIDPL